MIKPISAWRLPIFASAWMTFTFCLYTAGPLDWPKERWGSSAAIVLSSQLALLLGTYFSLRSKTRTARTRRTVDLGSLLWIGFALNLVTFPIALYGYTGSAIGDISFDLASQGDVYSARYDFLTSGGGGGIATLAALTRAVSAPFIFGGVVIGFRRFKNLSAKHRAWVLGSVGLQILFSFARATDKEIIDVAVFAVAATLASRTPKLNRRILRVTGALALAALITVVFVSRRESRLGDELGECFTSAQVCTSPNESTLAPIIGNRAYSGFAIGTGYVTQGYHGLSLAQDLDFEWTSGVGAHPVVARLFATGIGDSSVIDDTYQSRLAEVGWDPRFSWSSLYTHFANDFTFPGVPIAFMLIGLLLGKTWRRSLNGDLAAHVVATYLLLLLIYSPANNQVAVSLESFASFIVWLAAYFYGVEFRSSSSLTIKKASSEILVGADRTLEKSQ